MGASAGGLGALGTLLAGLPKDFQAPIVAVLHLDPTHHSDLARLLQRETPLKVQVARSGQRLRRGNVYVGPPNRHLEVRKGRVSLSRSARVRFSRPSIDRLFSSVATSHEWGAVAVVLTGAGSDGSAGIRDVRAAGGFVIAQDPSTAEFPSMPQSAIRTGCVDAEARLKAIAPLLVRSVAPSSPGIAPPEWPAVLGLLRRKMGTDFSGYKTTTLLRRLQRRVAASGQRDLSSYLRVLAADPAELRRLHSDFLIKVSTFFRDPEEWRTLAKQVIRRLATRAEGPSEIRVWSVGCATGEEAYSLAIVLSEALGGKPTRRFKVFATDLDEGALATARLGIYGAGKLAAVSAARLGQHFHRNGENWSVKASLRKGVVFGKHDLLRDPPLASMDLVVCRNVLIYLAPAEVSSALGRLRYAVRPGGYLFRGRSENRRLGEPGFERIEASAHIFRKVQIPKAGGRLRAVGNRPPPKAPPSEGREGRRKETEPGVARFSVGGSGRIITWNRAAEGLFRKAAMEAVGASAEKVLGRRVWAHLEPAAYEARVGGHLVRASGIPVRPSDPSGPLVDFECVPTGVRSMVEVTATLVRPVASAGPENALPTAARPHEDGGAIEALHAANEELETLNEQLSNTTEEQQTLNEELESRNEELETVNEELQSLNEELTTLNEEVGLQHGAAERLGMYLGVLLDLAPESIIGCDSDHQVTFWNKVATREFRLSPEQVIGRRIFDVAPALDFAAFRRSLRAERGSTVSRPPNPRTLAPGIRVDVRVVRDKAGRAQGHCLRVVWIGGFRAASSRRRATTKRGPARPRR